MRCSGFRSWCPGVTGNSLPSDSRRGGGERRSRGSYASRACARVRQVIGSPPECDCSYDTGGPGGAVQTAASSRHFDGGAAAQRLERGRERAGRCESGQQGGRAIPQSGDAVSRRLAGCTAGEVAFDLNALGTAQTLIQVGVELVLRNVPHESLCLGSAGRALLPIAGGRGPAWFQPLPLQDLFGP